MEHLKSRRGLCESFNEKHFRVWKHRRNWGQQQRI